MRTHGLLAAIARTTARHTKVATTAAAVLVAGAVVLPGQIASAPVPTAPSVRLASATRVAPEGGGDGYWLVSADGSVFAFGTAHLYGSMNGRHLTAPITGIVATADHRGYWLVAKDGGVFSFGDAGFAGSLGRARGDASVVGMAAGSGGGSTPSGMEGPAGVTGPAGSPGLHGRRGMDGAIGAPGVDGSAGPQGSPGSAGTPGSPGSDGTPGSAGSPGTAGTNGTNGNPGSPGTAGTNGTNGNPGSPGTAGTNGTDGAQGPVGPQGPVGAPGPAGLPNYAFVYNTTAQTVALEADITFGVNGLLTGFTHTPGIAGVVATNAGKYEVTFSVSGVEASEFALRVNGVAVAGGTYGSGAGTQQNNGQVIVNLVNGDAVTLTNHSSAAAVTLASPVFGTQVSVNASIVIEQLG